MAASRGSPISVWRAYKILFAAVQHRRGWKRENLVDELNKDAADRENFPWRYSVRATQYWDANPQGGKIRSSKPRQHYAEHLYDWFKKQIEELGLTQKCEAALAAIAPESRQGAGRDVGLELKPQGKEFSSAEANAWISDLRSRHLTPELKSTREILLTELDAAARRARLGGMKDAIVAAGMPPELPLASGELTDYAKALDSRDLTRAQKAIWKLCKAIYPPDGSRRCRIPKRGDQFDQARQKHAEFWHQAMEKAQLCYDDAALQKLAKSFVSEVTLIYALCWMDCAVALNRWYSGPGKDYLFMFGNYLTEWLSRSM